MFKKAIVVGASSGIGREIVRQLASTGCHVAAVARRKDRLDELAAEFPGFVEPVAHDVTKVDAVPALFQDTCRTLEGLDLFIYASGVMPEVGIKEFSFEKDGQMIDVNVSGAVAWLNEAAARFQGVGAGSIVAIGSVAGDRGRFAQPVYNASKAFLATYMEALRNRLHKLGVKVVTVKPGPVDTEMTANLHLKKLMTAETAASKIIHLANKPGEHYLQFTHRLIFTLIRHIPGGIFRLQQKI